MLQSLKYPNDTSDTKINKEIQYTMAMPSLPERMRISAHETTPGHAFSTTFFISCTYFMFLNPKFLIDSCSPGCPSVDANNNDASHPYYHPFIHFFNTRITKIPSLKYVISFYSHLCSIFYIDCPINFIIVPGPHNHGIYF